MKCLVGLFITALLFCASADAQQLVPWPQPTNLKIYLRADVFTEAEKAQVQAGVNSWRPFLPDGITLSFAGNTDSAEYCQGCITITHDNALTPTDLGECLARPQSNNRFLWYAWIIVDWKAGPMLQKVVEHEFGHALGMPHRNDSIMRPIVGGPDPSEKDALVLRALYPRQVQLSTADVSISSLAPLAPTIDVSKTEKLESETMAWWSRYQYEMEVLVQTLDLDDPSQVTGEYHQLSQIVLADNGKRIERVISKSAHLKNLRITKQDRIDFLGAMMGIIDFSRSRFTAGSDGSIHVEPISFGKGRGFKGDIWLDDQGGIAQSEGTTLPEKKERFPYFTATRKLVDGHPFPSEARAECVLHFPRSDVRARWKITFSNYKLFAGQVVSIKEVEQ